MNCVCGHSVFDHAKVCKISSSDPLPRTGGWFIRSVIEPTFTLSGPCLLRVSTTGRDLCHCKCQEFQRPISDRIGESIDSDLEFFWKREANFWRDLADMDPRPIHGMSRERVATGADLLASAETVAPAKAAKAWSGLLNPTGAAAIDRGLDAREWREWWKKYDRVPEPGPSEVM